MGAARSRHGTRRRRQAFRPRRSIACSISAQAQVDLRRRERPDLDGAGSAGLCQAVRRASRRPDETGGQMSRVYAIESTPTLLGAKADHRLAMRPAEIAIALRYIAGAVGAGPREWTQSETGRASWLAAAARGSDRSIAARVLVHAGREQPAEVHLLADAINGALGAFGATIGLIEPVAASPIPQPQSLAELDRRHGGRQGRHAADARHQPGLHRARRSRFRRRRWSACRSRSSLALYPRRDRAGQHLARPEGARIRSLERCARVRRHRDDPAAAGAAALRRPFGARGARGAAGQHRARTDYELVREYWQRRARTAGAAATSSAFWHEALRAGIVRTAPRRLCRSRRDAISLPTCRRRRREPVAAGSGCCSAPTRRSGTAASPTMPGCWSCRARSPG